MATSRSKGRSGDVKDNLSSSGKETRNAVKENPPKRETYGREEEGAFPKNEQCTTVTVKQKGDASNHENWPW